MFSRYLGLFLWAFLLSASAYGRLMPVRSYEWLVNNADVVAIIEPISSKQVDRVMTDLFPGAPGKKVLTLNTSFKVHAVLKGELKKDEPLIILHYVYEDDRNYPMNGAPFAKFFFGPLKVKIEVFREGGRIANYEMTDQVSTVLAFLKKRFDGQYVPVTGQEDAVCSFRQLHEMFYSPWIY